MHLRAILLLPIIACSGAGQSNCAGPIGALDNVSQGWIEGWACDPDLPDQAIRVAIYATDTPGDGDCTTLAGQLVCRIGIGSSEHSNSPNVASQCGGASANKGFRIPVRVTVPDWASTNYNPAGTALDYHRSYLLDGRPHDVYALAEDPGDGRWALIGGPVQFSDDQLYLQEPVYNLADHVFFGDVPGGRFPHSRPEDHYFNFYYHTVVTYWPAQEVRAAPLTWIDFGSFTGVYGDGDPWASQWVIGIPGYDIPEHPGSYGCYTLEGQTYCNAVGTVGESLGVLYDPRSYGSPANGVFLAHNWGWPYPYLWRENSGDGDRLRVEGWVKTPRSDIGDPRPGSDDNSVWGSSDHNVWYPVLVMHDAINSRQLWLSVQVFASNKAWPGDTAVDPNAPYTQWWGATRPNQSYAWIDYWLDPSAPQGMIITHLRAPTETFPGDSWVTPCEGSMWFPQKSTYQLSTPYDEDRHFCFTMSYSQMKAALHVVNQAAAVTDPGRRVRFGVASEDPKHYRLTAAVLNVEAWSFSDNPSRIGVSLRNFKVTRERAAVNYPPWGYADLGPDKATVSGWVCDRDDYNRALDVHFYATKAAGSNCSPINGEAACYVGDVIANEPSDEAVALNCGARVGPGHRFSWTVPAALHDGAVHKIYAMAINHPDGSNEALIGSPLVLAP